MKVIVEAIDGLEGLPVDYSLARELSKVALEIRETFNWKREVKPIQVMAANAKGR